MATLSVSDLQDLAVRCTTQFLAQGTPLNQLIAKEASDQGLNQEQVKRSVEAVNTLAYLKTLEKAGSDRTPEFQVADYTEVLKIASIPETKSMESLEQDPWLSFLSSSPGQTKQASDSTENPISDTYSPELVKSFIIKQASINARLIENLEVEAGLLTSKLIKAASVLALDPEAQSKLSVVSEGITFTKLARLVFKEDKVWKDLPQTLFNSRSLEKTAELKQCFEEAEELANILESRRSLQKQASEIVELEKQAFIGAVLKGAWGAAKNTARFVGGTAQGGRVAMLNRGVRNSAEAVTKGALGAAKLPFKPFTSAIKNEFNTGVNKLSESSIGKTFGVKGGLPTKPVFKDPQGNVVKKMGPFGAAMAVGGAAGDAMMYTPKTNPVTGEGGDIWKKLQG